MEKKPEEDFKKNFKRGIRGIVRHSKKYKKQFLALLVLGFFSALANASIPFITGKFFDSLINISQINKIFDLPAWMAILIIWAGVQIVTVMVDWSIGKINFFVDSRIHLEIQSSGYVHFLRLPVGFHKNAHIQDLIQKINTAGWRVSNIVRIFIELVPQLLSVFIGLFLVNVIDSRLTLILIIGVTAYVFLLFSILKKAAKIDEEFHKNWSESYDKSIEPITQIQSVKQSTSEEYESNKIIDSFIKKTFSSWAKLDKVWLRVSFFQRVVVFITQLSVFVFSVGLIKSNLISVGDLIAVNGYSMMFFGPFVQLGHSWQHFQNGITAAAHAEEVFEQEIENYHPENAVSKEIVGEIEFKNLEFKYENDESVLKDINLKINKGESIALVGKSGSGKSTFSSLISGYYFPHKGEILVDGVNTNQYDLINLRKQIAIVPQEISLFNDTIENNIKYGNFEATIEDVERVAKEACLEEFIKQQKDGYKTLVGERGVKLSVGQKQRLAIARAILRNPKILILDEPTSALDSVTEKFVTESLSRLMKNRTTIIIAHRLSTVRQADKIVVFEDGKIVEIGNHFELLKKENGYYKHLHDYQIGIY